MDENTAVVFHGFLNLSGLQKLKLVESINEYFDAVDREPLRQKADEQFASLEFSPAFPCKCCGRP
jgi:hypothetical protein